MSLDQKVSISPCVGIVYNKSFSLRVMLKIRVTQIKVTQVTVNGYFVYSLFYIQHNEMHDFFLKECNIC
jgi:hypothetical protein